MGRMSVSLPNADLQQGFSVCWGNAYMIGRSCHPGLVIGGAELQNSMGEGLVPVVRIWSLWFILRSPAAFRLESFSGCIFTSKMEFSELGKYLAKLILKLDYVSVYLSNFGVFYCLELRLAQLNQ